MVRILDSDGKYDKTTPTFCVFSGLSTDEKPNEMLITGSVFIEVDTNSAYMWDEVGEEWNEVGG